MTTETALQDPLRLGTHTFQSRLIVGTGKYATYELMRDCLDASGAEVVTVAVRRERLIDAQGRSILDFIDLRRYTILPNTAGCFSAEDAVRVARLGREILEGLDNPGANWVKLEVLGDKKTLLPDPLATLEATAQLVKEGFQVLVYTTDDPITARRLKDAGATSVMPAGSPIGSGQGVLNPNNIRICLEYLKEGDADYPVIIDAGVGTDSDVAFAMELGCDGVLLIPGIAGAKDP
ncbi:MAG: thiazole synthase, partial [Planctomycetaceae bacterium]